MRKWQDWVMLVLGVWLFISPFMLGYSGATRTNALIIGTALVVFSFVAILRPALWGEWINLVLGVWLVLGAFLLAAPESVARWNHLVVGILVVADALAAVYMRPEQQPQRPPLT